MKPNTRETNDTFSVTTLTACSRQRRAGNGLLGIAAILLALVGVSDPSHAATVDVYLQTEAYLKSLPDLVDPVPMWGFVCTPGAPGNGNCVAPLSVDLGSPRIMANPGDDLIIHLTNTLPTEVSLMIPGQLESGGGAPTTRPPDGQGRVRVRSFTHETATGTPATPSSEALYTWNTLRPGTYLYQSATDPSIQVPMGLYGALTVGPATGAVCTAPQVPAYDTVNSCNDAETLLLFSEIDPWQNAAVDAAAGVVSAYPSTIDYTPTHFLINWESYSTSTPPPPLPAGDPDDRVLLRLLNAGLRSHVPTLVGLQMDLVAEDGYPYPGDVRRQSSILLPAGKTMDVLVDMPNTNATYPLYDRMLDVSNDNQPDGGMLTYLEVGTGSTPPPPYVNPAVNDTFNVIEDTPFLTGNVLDNDDPALQAGMLVTLLDGPQNGVLVLNADGTFSYTPNANFSGTDSFTYSASDGSNTYAATVTLSVSFVNDAPVAAADGPYVNIIGPDVSVAAPGVLGNDSDSDGDYITAVVDALPATGTLQCGVTPGMICPDGSFVYTGGTPGGSESFTYHTVDEIGASSASVTVSLNINPIPNIALTVQDQDGVAVTEYRWLVQHDATFPNNPNSNIPVNQQLSLNFHRSHIPVVAQGCVGAACDPDNPAVPIADFAQVALDPANRYYVSILPNDAGTGTGHSIGGAQIPVGATAVTVVTNNQPIPPASISIVVFEDVAPTNGVIDPNEQGLGGWEITVEDAGGRYGQNGGIMSQDADGNPLKNALDCAPPATEGVILTCPDGTALVANLPPGKYGVFATPPGDQVDQWTQTSTIEGTKVIDAWVKANEPPFFVEAGGLGFHVFLGFVNPNNLLDFGGSNTLEGNVTLWHDPRPPGAPSTTDSGSYDALAHTRAWLGLNSSGGFGTNIKTVRADPDGHFVMNNIPDGQHQLVIWDDYLDQILGQVLINLPADAGNMGNVPVNAWFGRLEHNVFLDEDEDGVYDPTEMGLTEQAVNLRFRDGSMYLSFPTDTTGFVPFDQTFPFFAWQVAEVDYTRFKPTGVTVTVDAGGDVSTGPYVGLLYPQVGSPRTDTEPAPVLLEGFQIFPGQTSLFDWGKAPYLPGENGGISGIVFYSSTRGENDPRLTVGDTWEPGIANVKVRLYREVARDPALVDVDNEPLGNFPTVADGDIDHNGNGIFDGPTKLALVEEVMTDSWDASLPTDCPGEVVTGPFVTQSLGSANITRCYDGWRNWNQIRPGVFDGGYAFTGIPPGKYVVEVVPPAGYEVVKEEDKNVDFGDVYATNNVVAALGGPTVQAAGVVEPGLAQPPCVGADHLVPSELSLFPGIPAPFAGDMRPLCDRKEVILSDQSQAAADFHVFTATPVAGQFFGLITDDVATETRRASPTFGEKYTPPHMPVSIRDYLGQEVYRTYSDEFGKYNGLVPSTFTANVPIPSGYSPAMYDACMNDPGPGANLMTDPFYIPEYGQFCYAAQYMPGTTTYLDTPVLPGSAFASGFNPVDCALVDQTPGIAQVTFLDTGAPWHSTTNPGSISILSLGQVDVPNPAYDDPATGPPPYNQLTRSRDYRFGNSGTVTLNGVPLDIVSWNQNEILVSIPASTMVGECSANSSNPGAVCSADSQCPPNSGKPANRGFCENLAGMFNPESGQLEVIRGDNSRHTVNGITLELSDETPITVPTDYATIQAAIDAANAGDLILVQPGVYQEYVVMWKPVRLQGAGAGNTVIDALNIPMADLNALRTFIEGLVTGGQVDLLPGQPDGGGVGAGLLANEMGAAITVLAKNDGSFSTNPSRIDGFTITGASAGGIFVNGWANNLEIANNVVTLNTGNLNGGIRVGHAFLPLAGSGPFAYNTGINIHDNQVTRNSAIGETGAGGGISLLTGTDNYRIADSFICGNFTLGDGGGIGHLGLSDNGLIEYNEILFNQNFNQGLTKSGGGIAIAGEPPAPGNLTLGSGSVNIHSNRIQGNQAGTGHGGGIRLQAINGVDATGTPWTVEATNNILVNNVAAWTGGGISVMDAIDVSIVNNTVANNDSTATVGALVSGGNTTPQPAGISTERYSLLLQAELGAPNGFSDPLLANNIVWHNRAFTLIAGALTPALSPLTVGECPAGAVYVDLGVVGETAGGLMLNPTDSVLTDDTGYDVSNTTGDPLLLSEYCNAGRSLRDPPGPMLVSLAGGEGGNFIDVRYGPLTQAWPEGNAPWDYHIGDGSSAVDLADVTVDATVVPTMDFDRQNRPQGAGTDSGADEIVGGGAPPPPPPPGPTEGTLTFFSATVGLLVGDTLDFGRIGGNGSVTSTVQIAVTVNPITFGTLTVTGDTAYSQGADTCSGQIIPAGGFCSVDIQFQYDGNKPKNGALNVPNNGVNAPHTLGITGR